MPTALIGARQDPLRASAAAIKDRVLHHLDSCLLQLELTVQAAGGVLHRAADAADADRIVLGLVRRAGTRVGITGANFVVAESGTVVLVESEGNARMGLTRPETLISVVGIEQIVPTWRDLEVFLEPRAGERMPHYVCTWAGVTDGDAPREFHLVVVSNARTRKRAAALPTGRHAVAVPREYPCHAPGIEPGDHAAVLSLFTDRLKHNGTQTHRVTAAALPETIAAALAEHGAHTVVAPTGVPEPWLAEWAAAASHRLVADDPELTPAGLDKVDAIVTSCAVAVADPGIVVLDGGDGQGRRAPILTPSRHICVVRAEQVASVIPEVIALLDPARPLTWVSGPARRLVVLLVEPEL